jgi:nicotinate-nucleotide pyrophosphorylase (carboxylating)
MIAGMDFSAFGHLVRLALDEDLADAGDVTTGALFTDETGVLTLLSKDTGVLAGSGMFDLVFQEIDNEITIEWLYGDGASLSPGDTVAIIAGKSASLLAGERTALNFLSFLSGISTMTRRYVDAAADAGRTTVLDTRKTLPGYRQLSKYAVRVGGGTNHRMGLFDMVMLKDNHIDLCGSITEAVSRVRHRWGNQFRLEVECRTVADVNEAVAAGADVVMLDNMDQSTIRSIVNTPHGAVKLEASGNVDLDSIGAISSTGVDLISIGRITHSVPAFDFSLRYETDGKAVAAESTGQEST